MLVNYILLAFRNLIKQRSYAVVNILGLAFGLASAIFILLYVNDEMTFDTIHPKASQTYRIGYSIQYPNGDVEAGSYAPAGWDNYIQSNFSSVTDITGFANWGMPTSVHYQPKDRIIMTEAFLWAEPNIGTLVSMPVVKGAPDPLKEVNSIVLTETSAKELFGTEDPIDKLVSVSNQFATNRQQVEMRVTAVVKDFPSNSHISPKYVANILALKPFNQDLENQLNTSMGGGNNGFWTQSLFACTDESQIPLIVNDLQKKANEVIAKNNWNFKFTPLVRKITDVHFDKSVDWAVEHKAADKKYIYVFITIALLILVVAAINYINLSTAKSASRAREIGLRKAFGGVRGQLFFQFMMESFLLVFLSAAVAILIVILLMPQFNTLTQKTFTISHVVNLQMLGIIGAVVIFVTLLAGSYPALFVSSFQPAIVLKGKFSFRRGSTIFRQFLTTLQFVVAVILLTGTVIIVRQMDLMRNSKLNEAGKQIVSIRFGGFSGPTTNEKFKTFKNFVLEDPEIHAITLANHLPRLDFFGSINMDMQFPEISEEKHSWFQLNGDYDFPKTFGLKIIAGRDFDHKNISDSSAVLLNESALRSLKVTAAQIIGKSIVRPAYSSSYDRRDSTRLPVTGIVIGVVEDFPYKSMHNKIDPLGISPVPHPDDRIIHVRLPATKMAEKIQFLEKTWKTVFPEYGFDYWFIDREFGRMYENETRVAALTEKFSWLAILITCVGLYGLASFMSEQRTKEIGIRKTLGASSGQVLFMLLSVFAKLILIACVIALPVAYFLSGQWLESFVYRTPLTVFVFGGSVGIILLITLLTVGYESLKASLSNPVTALRHE